ncbi:MAG: hypothetical protein CFH37_00932 [Alphaproteobacteria bacterium MarineAlpha9_Bin7]|nr:MAG: hypothetical protein CFH37_00932 [Alphaproteobacteria bacterium MarineAlpha9_Bin7]
MLTRRERSRTRLGFNPLTPRFHVANLVTIITTYRDRDSLSIQLEAGMTFKTNARTLDGEFQNCMSKGAIDKSI